MFWTRVRLPPGPPKVHYGVTVRFRSLGWGKRLTSIGKCTFDGPVMVSTGQRVTEWTARECETRRVGGKVIVAMPIA